MRFEISFEGRMMLEFKFPHNIRVSISEGLPRQTCFRDFAPIAQTLRDFRFQNPVDFGPLAVKFLASPNNNGEFKVVLFVKKNSWKTLWCTYTHYASPVGLQASIKR